MAGLLDTLQLAGATGQVTTLLARDPAAHASLDDPGGVARLLRSLREAGADKQAVTLLGRDPAAHVSLDNPSRYVADLLDTLREDGAVEQAATLEARLPVARMFKWFLEQPGVRDRFCFGREADGTPAEPWEWSDPG